MVFPFQTLNTPRVGLLKCLERGIHVFVIFSLAVKNGLYCGMPEQRTLRWVHVFRATGTVVPQWDGWSTSGMEQVC